MSGIEWTDVTWNPTRGCSRVSEGCRNCYAERMAARFSKPGQPFHGFADPSRSRMLKPRGHWTGRVELVPAKLDEPLRWRKPRRVFVNSMSDLFHEALPLGDVARVLDVITAAKRHTFQVLTKRAERMRDFFVEVGGAEGLEPPPNLWLGVSVEDQRTADERIPLLRQTPAAVRFISVEPMLEQLDLCLTPGSEVSGAEGAARGIHWVIVGGESGPGARPFDLAWARSILAQCREAGVPCFVKQLGTRPLVTDSSDPGFPSLHLKHPKGGDPAEWPEDLRVREWPR